MLSKFQISSPSDLKKMQIQQHYHQESAMTQQICPATNLVQKVGYEVKSVCHVPDARTDHRCKVNYDCGTDSITCRDRSCSLVGYCGLWLHR